MKTIYVLKGRTGEYEDTTSWILCCYTKEEEVKKHLKLLTDWLRNKGILFDGEKHLCWEYLDQDDLKKCPYDPDFEVESTGTEYFYFEVDLYDDFENRNIENGKEDE